MSDVEKRQTIVKAGRVGLEKLEHFEERDHLHLARRDRRDRLQVPHLGHVVPILGPLQRKQLQLVVAALADDPRRVLAVVAALCQGHNAVAAGVEQHAHLQLGRLVAGDDLGDLVDHRVRVDLEPVTREGVFDLGDRGIEVRVEIAFGNLDERH